MLGVDDPRSSGLGTWRDETGLSFDEVGQPARRRGLRLRRPARSPRSSCTTPNLADEALARGCADLVLAGHLHVQERPDPGRRRERRDRLQLHDRHDRRRGVRHRDRRQAAARRRRSAWSPTATAGRSGIQPVTLRTTGAFDVADYIPLHLSEPQPVRDAPPPLIPEQ